MNIFSPKVDVLEIEQMKYQISRLFILKNISITEVSFECIFFIELNFQTF